MIVVITKSLSVRDFRNFISDLFKKRNLALFVAGDLITYIAFLLITSYFYNLYCRVGKPAIVRHGHKSVK